ncbi:MAG: hypothetical protein ACFCVK_13610 [Acidimicrobiales bacterium]
MPRCVGPALAALTTTGARPVRHALGFPVVHVYKRRCRFRIGLLRAETAELDGPDLAEPLNTLAIEGRHLTELVSIRAALGLGRATNSASHVAVEARCCLSVSSRARRLPATGWERARGGT